VLPLAAAGQLRRKYDMLWSLCTLSPAELTAWRCPRQPPVQWLAEAGHAVPPVKRVDAHFTYVTRMLRMPEDWDGVRPHSLPTLPFLPTCPAFLPSLPSVLAASP